MSNEKFVDEKFADDPSYRHTVKDHERGWVYLSESTGVGGKKGFVAASNRTHGIRCSASTRVECIEEARKLGFQIVGEDGDSPYRLLDYFGDGKFMYEKERGI